MPPKAPKQKKDDSFRDFVLDALHGLPDLRSKAMFGGLGLSMGENFFGIVWNGRLYFKVDEQSRIEYASRGAKPFTYSRDGKKMTMSYYEVPAELLDDHERLRAWAVGAAAAGSPAKAKKTRKKK
jgi:DNA transformation protein